MNIRYENEKYKQNLMKMVIIGDCQNVLTPNKSHQCQG